MQKPTQNQHTVRDCVELIKVGELTSEQWVADCFGVIDATDDTVQAWAQVDRDKAIADAQSMDDLRLRGKPTGALHGVPIGIKDIFDTCEYPTERGSSIFKDRQPDQDCAVVERLKEAGAVVLGKTVTTEFAFMHPSKTCNPHNLDHTPGGSSSGSAAAIAAGQVSLTIGSQTNGSVIRPASFCGVYGFKPTRGIVSRRGVLETSPTLDQVGYFSRDLGDLALLGDVLSNYDAADKSSYNQPKPELVRGYTSAPPVEPNFAWIDDLPYANLMASSTLEGFDELREMLGKQVERIPSPRSFSALLECHKIIYRYEIYRCLERERERHLDQLSDTMREALNEASTVSKDQYDEAISIMHATQTWFDQFFNEFDAILTPAALGEAPLAADLSAGTGNPACCTIWTLSGLPCLSLPLLVGHQGLPVGVQLVANAREDDRLFRTARWLIDQLDDNTSPNS